MVDIVEAPEVSPDDFVRRFSVRVPNVMWLLGAGASAAAGIATAYDMIWEFKQQLFVSQRRVSLRSVEDLTSPAIRTQLQNYIDSLKTLPPVGAPDEYAALFETVYPSEKDRRAYMEAKVAGAKPSFAHMALATLMRSRHARLVWTTNFDSLVADACAKVFGSTGPLTTVALDAPDLALDRINEERWPIEVKLHGDFRSRRLKNTGDELRQQDTRLRKILVDCCRRFGLVVAGYSGRDNSIMDTLEEVMEQPDAFPAGLFWMHRGEGPPLDRVTEFLLRANSRKVEAALVRIENFDEAMRDLIRLVKDIDSTLLDAFAAERSRWSAAPRPAGKQGWPVVRLNALPVTRAPSVCRRISCDIGGHAEVRAAIDESGADILAARTRAGVLAYGNDDEIRKVFEPFRVADFDLHTIEPRRLRYDSGERGLLRQALTRAISRHRRLDAMRRRSSDLFAPSDPTHSAWTNLKQRVGSLHGTVGGNPDLRWREGLATRLDWADDRLWLLIEPRVVFDGLTEENRAAATDFARERSVKRYNQQLNDLTTFWANHLVGDGGEFAALEVREGIDAVFRLSSATAFSWRVGV